MNSRNYFLPMALLAAGCNGSDGGSPGDTDAPASAPQIFVNEVMALNTSTLAEGTFFPDWVELWNPGDETVDLSGWWLSDDRDDPFNWNIPVGVTIGAGEYVVIFCDDDEIEGDLHASFHISGDNGEDVALFGPDALGNPWVDSIDDLQTQFDDVSYARLPDGSSTTDFDETPTPAAPNN